MPGVFEVIAVLLVDAVAAGIATLRKWLLVLHVRFCICIFSGLMTQHKYCGIEPRL